jgi:membrane-associated phospholipid phosphatase
MEFLTGYVVFNWIATWASPFFDVFFRAATDLGYHTFYYLAVAPLFWVVDRRRACMLFLLVLASGYINTFAKLWVHTPRPDPRLTRVLDFRPYQSGSNAFPSGHAQNAVVFWGYLAWWVGRRWFSVLAVFLVVAIAFSRLYLAVHFPIDIVGGLGLGIALMLILPRPLERWSRSNFRLGVAGIIGLVAATLALTLASTDLTLAMISGSLIGFLAGAAWLPQAPLVFSNVRQATAAAAAGLVILFALSAVFESLPYNALALYAQIAALWIIAIWGYPQLLHRVLPTAVHAS